MKKEKLQLRLFNQEQGAFNALQQGNENGLDFFFKLYYVPLVSFSTSITNNNQASQEIGSESFVKLWRDRGSLTDSRSIKFLLYRMVRNASIDYLREHNRINQQLKHLEAINEFMEGPVLNKLIEAETNNHLYQLLACLSPRGRQIFQMFYFEDKAIKEIAEELGVSVNTVKTQKLRAIKLLREKQASFILGCILAIPLFF